MFVKIMNFLQANKFLFYLALAIILLVGYLITRIIGVIPTVAAVIFFTAMHRAKDKRKYIVALKIMGALVLVLAILLYVVFANMEMPMH
ncbi:MAG: hypothetical protein V4732_22585 [Pseudomonadota bacterium]